MKSQKFGNLNLIWTKCSSQGKHRPPLLKISCISKLLGFCLYAINQDIEKSLRLFSMSLYLFVCNIRIHTLVYYYSCDILFTSCCCFSEQKNGSNFCQLPFERRSQGQWQNSASSLVRTVILFYVIYR